MDTDAILRNMVEKEASDLFLKVGTPPAMRVRGQLQNINPEPINRAELLQFAYDLMGPERQKIFQEERELNFAFDRLGIGRFRANALWQRGTLGLVIRRVSKSVPSFEDLRLPVEVLKKLAEESHGLVLVTGPTGSGKSTTVASVIEHINENYARHIVTLEDPIEYLFEEKRSLITQREIGIDTRSFTEGLKNVLRQNPDVLYISDIRDIETMESALHAAEAGQLVLSCVHTTNVMTTIERVVTLFPPHQHNTVRFRLSMALRGILCLRLIPRLDGSGRMPAYEIMVMTPTIRQLLQEAKTGEIPALLQSDTMHGMQTMTKSLINLVKSGQISVQDALSITDSPNELQRALKFL